MAKTIVALVFVVFASSSAYANCRQALAFGLDVSGSVNEQEYILQREGLANALLSPMVQQAIFAMPNAPIKLMVFEWSATSYQRVLVDWKDMNTPSDLEAFSKSLVLAPQSKRPYSTGLSGAMKFGVSQLKNQSGCWRRTLDISGDGIANDGPFPSTLFRAEGIENIVINGLIIGAADKNGSQGMVYETRKLAKYYEDVVVRGTDAFVETAFGFGDYYEAMQRKLLREIPVIAISSNLRDIPRLAKLESSDQ